MVPKCNLSLDQRFELIYSLEIEKLSSGGIQTVEFYYSRLDAKVLTDAH